MKKLKNAMLFTIGGLAFATIAITSCKSSSSGTPAPTVTSFTPSSATPGTTVTITGTNFTGATAVAFGGTPAVSFIVVNSTTITAVIGTGSTGLVSVTTPGGTSSSGTSFTFHAGATSDSVAKAALIAHWTFDASSAEQGSGVTANSSAGVTYTSAGQIGNCATFTNGYLVYPVIANINHDTALESYTISMWVSLPAATGSDPLRSLFQITGNRFPDIWGQVAFELANDGSVGDTLALQARQVQVDGTSPYVHNQATGGIHFGNSIPNKWTFITQTYNGNGSNQTVKIYANGNVIDSTQFSDVDKTISSTQTTFRIVPTGGSPTPTPANNVYIGTLAFFDRGNTGGDGYGNFAPTWSIGSYPWAAESITGQIDDIRVFNRELTKVQVDSLYTLGSAGK